MSRAQVDVETSIPESPWVDEGDEEISRIREVRHRISEEFGHDPYRMVAHYMELQKKHPEKLVRAPHSDHRSA